MSYFSIRRSKDKQWYFREVGDNGETLATSETYTRIDDAVSGAKAAGATENTIRYEPEGDE